MRRRLRHNYLANSEYTPVVVSHRQNAVRSIKFLNDSAGPIRVKTRQSFAVDDALRLCYINRLRLLRVLTSVFRTVQLSLWFVYYHSFKKKKGRFKNEF